MPTRRKRPKTLHLDLSPVVVEKLDLLVESTGALSRSEVIRSALEMLSAVQDWTSNGGSVVLRDTPDMNGEQQEHLLFIVGI